MESLCVLEEKSTFIFILTIFLFVLLYFLVIVTVLMMLLELSEETVPVEFLITCPILCFCIVASMIGLSIAEKRYLKKNYTKIYADEVANAHNRNVG